MPWTACSLSVKDTGPFKESAYMLGTSLKTFHVKQIAGSPEGTDSSEYAL